MKCIEHVYFDAKKRWHTTWPCGQDAYGVSERDLNDLIMKHKCATKEKRENA